MNFAYTVPGNPGAGKTVLAATVAEELQIGKFSTGSKPAIYYYFFDNQSPTSCRPSDAYRSIVAQMLWENREDPELLHCLTFIMAEKSQGQLIATETELFDILRLCLPENAILIIDGIDECSNSESFVESLLRLSNSAPELRQILFSRVNVPALELSVPLGQIFTMPKAKIGLDIYRFFLVKLEDMIDDKLLPDTSTDQKETLADRLCRGADGMFLWARLMIRCLCSPYLTKQYRLKMISEVNFPEGLEKMYERIVTVIHESGSNAADLASKTFTWLAFSACPVTARQLRQAFTVQNGSSPPQPDEEISEFQECVNMACAGLVEQSNIDPNSECPEGEPTLRFVHLSLLELIVCQSKITEAVSPSNLGPCESIDQSSLPKRQAPNEWPHLDGHTPKSYLLLRHGDTTSVFQPLVAKPADANVLMSTCCLQQLLYHTPAQPLAGSFNKKVSETDLNQDHCFTSYAAVYWISYLKSCLGLMDGRRFPSQSGVMNFVKLLSIILAKPCVLSSWLEAYYIARYQRETVGYHHPPITVLCDWVDIIASSLGDKTWVTTLVQEVQESDHALAIDVETIVATWGLQLDNTPEIIWDEMTFYANSRFFFSPESLKVSIQKPEPPNYPNISRDPVAKMSKTSSSGDVKGVLCIWAPQLVLPSISR